ncbi:SDR family oxidoreductase (plasmid) [Rhizobium leguminosarum]|uniref:SDR family NAD(P)-dependent oxidoreductase n=1 Tax=Rhizobium leguminosarum TaxID=384 RepID=UPI00102FF933|nr:SDR family NAD(P)-dependent oxidoreductase [Rhizobium leguminosarum]TBF87000.1 SDR family oxidoreductase [Rhizobium leguminosarum]TBG01218.1 SDR family oxidoreductase [Rhizobium leguminosarum]TBG55766.1 SDR family oxidoreductase [Rhizobium leguminosarum]
MSASPLSTSVHTTGQSVRLAGRRIIVTGAASGIGRTTAALFAAEGAKVTLFDRNTDAVQKVAEEIAACFCSVDITNEPDVARAVEKAASEMDGIDGLINAAGIMSKGLATEVPADDWRRIIEVNLTGTYIVARCCIPFLQLHEHSTIVNIASAQGLLPNAPGHTAYAASKGGVVNLTRALAAELAPKIRVNSIAPGMVDTPMADGYRANVGNYALKRLADPEEIARALLFLTSSESSYVTGAALAVDGGRSFH